MSNYDLNLSIILKMSQNDTNLTRDLSIPYFRELIYPTYVLDLMVVCWAQQPRDRPSASQVVSIASAPEFVHLGDVVSLADYGSCCAQVHCRIA